MVDPLPLNFAQTSIELSGESFALNVPSSISKDGESVQAQLDRIVAASREVLRNEALRSPDLQSGLVALETLQALTDSASDTEMRRANVHSYFFGTLDLATREMAVKMMLMEAVLFDAALKALAFKSYESDQYRTQQADRISAQQQSARSPESVRFHLGILGKETEPLNFAQVRALSTVSELLHTNADQPSLGRAIAGFWAASWERAADSETDIQLHYATQVYRSFAGASERIGDALLRAGSDKQAPPGWLQLFTWLRGDVDGRPYESTEDTEALLGALRERIFALYREDVTQLAETLSNEPAAGVILAQLQPENKLAYDSPQAFIRDLENAFGIEPARKLVDKVHAFGFHFVQIELRQNSHALAAALEEIISPEAIGDATQSDPRKYSVLSISERITLLTAMQSEDARVRPDKIWNSYLAERRDYLDQKAQLHAGKDYTAIREADPEYCRTLDIIRCVDRIKLIGRFPESIHLHGIAETKGPADILALLFLNEAAGNRYGADIAMQPEDPQGALALLTDVHQLYGNPVYRDHLAHRGNTQYLTCGPSDTGKSGGKALHKGNAVIASRHRDIAREHGIELIVHPIIGYEHSRGNGPFGPVVQEYDAISSPHTRFTMAGLKEMRAHFGARAHTSHSLSDMFLAHLQDPQGHERARKDDVDDKASRIAEWFGGVGIYEQLFFQHPQLPAFLKEVARFDVIAFAWKGKRPLARDSTVAVEDDPAAIRAIPFSRAMMMGGIFAEALGGSLITQFTPEELRARAKEDRPFRDYLKGLAYAASRTDLDHAWRTLGVAAPDVETRRIWARLSHDREQGEYAARNLLSAVHEEVETIRAALSEAFPGAEGGIGLLDQWPALAAEVRSREQALRLPKLLLEIGRVGEPKFSPQLVKDLSAVYFTLVNTAVSFLHPDGSQQWRWE